MGKRIVTVELEVAFDLTTAEGERAILAAQVAAT
jgi:hypothetical protein